MLTEIRGRLQEHLKWRRRAAYCLQQGQMADITDIMKLLAEDDVGVDRSILESRLKEQV